MDDNHRSNPFRRENRLHRRKRSAFLAGSPCSVRFNQTENNACQNSQGRGDVRYGGQIYFIHHKYLALFFDQKLASQSRAGN